MVISISKVRYKVSLESLEANCRKEFISHSRNVGNVNSLARLNLIGRSPSFLVFGLLLRVHCPMIPCRLGNRGMIASYENIRSVVSFFLLLSCYAQSIDCCSAVWRSTSFSGQLSLGTLNAVSAFVFSDCFLVGTMKHTDSLRCQL